MACSATKEIRIAIMPLTPENALPRISIGARIQLLAHVRLIRITRFTRSNPSLQSDLGIEERLFQVEWFKDFFLCQFSKLVSRHALQQNSERDKSQIAVNHAASRLVLEIETRDRTSRALRFVLSQNIKRTPCRQT